MKKSCYILIALTVCNALSLNAADSPNFDITVGGGLNPMPVTVSMADDLPGKLIRVGTGLACNVTGINLIAKGIEFELRERHKQPHVPADLEQGLHQSESTPSLSSSLVVHDDEKLTNNRSRCSTGIKAIITGICFVCGGTITVFSNLIFGK